MIGATREYTYPAQRTYDKNHHWILDCPFKYGLDDSNDPVFLLAFGHLCPVYLDRFPLSLAEGTLAVLLHKHPCAGRFFLHGDCIQQEPPVKHATLVGRLLRRENSRRGRRY